jgi:hypothetical protein
MLKFSPPNGLGMSFYENAKSRGKGFYLGNEKCDFCAKEYNYCDISGR